MTVKEFIQKLLNRETSHVKGEALSADEVELGSYLRQERRDRIKRQLQYYRNKQAREDWTKASLFKGDGSIMKAKNIFRRKL